MNIVLRLVLIFLTVVYLGFLINSIKKQKIQLSFSTFWIISDILLIIAIAIPNWVEKISSYLGIQTPSNMVFLITIFVAYVLIFDLTVKLSQEHKKNVLLIQEISMIKKRIEKLESNEK